MKKILSYIVMAFFGVSVATTLPGFAQDNDIDEDDAFLNGFEYENIQEESGLKPYRILGVGYNANFLMNDLDDFNAIASEKLGLGEIKTPIYLNSYDFILSIEPMKNFYLGFSRGIGSKSVDKQLSGTLDGYKRSLKYGVSYTDLELGWSFVPMRKFAIQPAVNVGLTNLNIETYQTVDSEEYNDFFTNDDANQYYRKMNGYFISVEPHIALQYKVVSNVMIRGTVGYRINMSPDWKMNFDSDLSNVPDEHKPNGLIAKVGLYLGIIEF